MPCAAEGPLISEQLLAAALAPVSRVRTPPPPAERAPPAPAKPDDGPHPRWGLAGILWSPHDMVRAERGNSAGRASKAHVAAPCTGRPPPLLRLQTDASTSARAAALL
jgi:hypothetical protein